MYALKTARPAAPRGGIELRPYAIQPATPCVRARKPTSSRACNVTHTMQVRSVASVSFALLVLRQHCQSFQIYDEHKGQPRLKRAALDQAVRCYYHSGAFGVEKKPTPPSHKKAKK